MMRADRTEVSAGTRLNERVGVPELVRLVAQRKPVIRRHDLAVLADGREDHEMGAGAGASRPW